MKVNGHNLSGASAAETSRAQEAQQLNGGQSTRTGTAPSTSEDRVELSSTLGQLSKALSSYGSSQADRVQALAAQYQSGNYRTDSLATSRGIVSEAMAGIN